MALTVRKVEIIKYRDEEKKIPVARFDLDCDTTSDLPENDVLEGKKIGQGSIAWIIKDGEFYGYSSDGEWNKQGDS